MQNSYRTSHSQYTVEKRQVGNQSSMEQIHQSTPTTYYDEKHNIQIMLTFTNEIEREQLDKELTILLESHYSTKILGKQ